MGESAATWISRRRVDLARALAAHRPITAQEELATQRREEPEQAVGDGFGVRLVGHTFGAVQQVALGDGFTTAPLFNCSVSESDSRDVFALWAFAETV